VTFTIFAVLILNEVIASCLDCLIALLFFGIFLLHKKHINNEAIKQYSNKTMKQ